MRKLIWLGILMLPVWLTGCQKYHVGKTYKSLPTAYPVSPTKYGKLNLMVKAPENVNKEELENFKELIVLALEVRGITVVDVRNSELPELAIEVLKLNKEGLPTKFLRRELVPGPWVQETSNALQVKVLLTDKERVSEFKEFQDFKESVENWEDLKIAVANRIADAVYFAAR